MAATRQHASRGCEAPLICCGGLSIGVFLVCFVGPFLSPENRETHVVFVLGPVWDWGLGPTLHRHRKEKRNSGLESG